MHNMLTNDFMISKYQAYFTVREFSFRIVCTVHIFCSVNVCDFCWKMFYSINISNEANKKENSSWNEKSIIAIVRCKLQISDCRYTFRATANRNGKCFEYSCIWAFSYLRFFSRFIVEHETILICWWESRILIQADQRHRNLHFDLETLHTFCDTFTNIYDVQHLAVILFFVFLIVRSFVRELHHAFRICVCCNIE